MEFLESLRRKPKHVKVNFAFGGALTVTLLIAVIWLSVLPARLHEVKKTIEEQGTEQTAGVQDSFMDLLEQAQQNLEVPTETEEVETFETQPQMPTSALGDLYGWETRQPEPSESAPTAVDQAPSSRREPLATSTPIAPKSATILIGTTTKKTE